MAGRLKKIVSKAKQRQAKRRKKIKKYIEERPQRVAKRQDRRTSIIEARQKGKRARFAAREGTGVFKDRFREQAQLQDVGFDPVTGQMDESFLSDTFEGGGGGAMGAFADFDTEGAITDKVWFWPVVIGGAALLLFMNKDKKKG
tara:strand:+ start:4989 stop:5420 length:432 start_codon:yes stop_codon:yes gene_type:complete